MLTVYPEYLPDCVYLLLSTGIENSELLDKVIGNNKMTKCDFYTKAYQISVNNEKLNLPNHISHEKIKKCLPYEFVISKTLNQKIDLDKLGKLVKNFSIDKYNK